MNNKNSKSDSIFAFSKAKGLSGEELKTQCQLPIKEKTTLDKAVEEFVKKADTDPTTVNITNCATCKFNKILKKKKTQNK